MNDSVGVVWENPPSKMTNPKPRKWEPILEEAQTKPGEWARIKNPFEKKQAYSLATRINTGKLAGTDRGEYEAMARRKGEQHFVWVRFVGDSEE